MATILRQALQGQQPAPQLPPNPMQGQMDPIQVLMDEYKRLDQAHPQPMYTPEQQSQRIQQNNDALDVGALGQASGDHALGQVGGQVFKQALQQRAPVVDRMGSMDPLTGERAIDPAYTASLQQQRRGKILEQALKFEDQRQRAQERMAIMHDNNLTRQMIGDARWGGGQGVGGAGGGAGHNLKMVTDQNTGEQFWVDPRNPSAPAQPVRNLQGGTSVVPEKLPDSDNKALTGLAGEQATLMAAMSKVKTNPDAFGAMKGLPNQVPGVLGTTMQAIRDRNMSQGDIQARAGVYNVLSALIKERAGTAQSKQELARLQGFLPSDMDDAPRVMAKLQGYQQYLAEKEGSLRARYTGPRPVQNLGGPQQPQQVPTPGQPAPMQSTPGAGRFRVIGVTPGGQ